MSWNGAKIKVRAKEINISINHLASNLKVSRQTIHSWMTGQTPRGQHLMKLCNNLKTEPSYFFASELEDLVSVPRHRTVRKKKVTDKMQKASLDMAQLYVNLFRQTPSSSILRVIRIKEHKQENAIKIADELRNLSGINNDKPMDLEHALKMLKELGIYAVFRNFPIETSKSIYAFYSKICAQRVIFINNQTNVIDLIFQLLHEAIHAIRDEQPELIDEDTEERFCDQLANYIQFPDEYVSLVAKYINGCPPSIKVNRLKEFSSKYQHSIFGIKKRLEFIGESVDLNIGGADTNLKREFLQINKILFQNNDARRFIELMNEWSPLFVGLIAKNLQNSSVRKLNDWLGLDTIMDSKAIMSEIERLKI